MRTGNTNIEVLKQAIKQTEHAERESEKPSSRSRSLYESVGEPIRLEDVGRVMETFLLTAMGTFGSTIGFVLLIDTESLKGKISHRGLENDEVNRLDENIPQMFRRYFSSTSAVGPSSSKEARLVARNKVEDHAFLPDKTKVLIQWGVDQRYVGFLGLGKKMVGEFYGDDDTELVLNLANKLAVSINNARCVEFIQRLNTDLQRENVELKEALRQAECTQDAIARRVYHLRALYDTTLELVGNKETREIAEIFLLIALGTFTVGDGYILLLDRQQKHVHVILPGIERENVERLTADDLQKVIIEFLDTSAGKEITPMTAREVTSKTLVNNPALPMNAEMGVLFVVDDNCCGLMGLGSKITREGYSGEEKALLLTLVNNFMVFLARARSFETIQKLNTELEKRNFELKRTIEEVTASKLRIEMLERAKSHVKSVIQREMERTRRVAAIDFVLILGVSLVLGLIFNLSNPGGLSLIPESWSRTPPPFIDLHLAKLKYDEGATLFVDARPADFFKQRHIQGAVNLPLPLFDFVYMMKFNSLDPEREIIVYGRNISRHYDGDVAFKLASRGHVNVKVLSGGMSAWKKKDYPLEP